MDAISESPTKLPMVSSTGQQLCVCGDCDGKGSFGRAEKTKYDKNQVGRLETLDRISPRRCQSLRRHGWKVETYRCANCSGSGLIQVGESSHA